ncbi:MAG: DUF4351 domain-containing protein [Scytonematopsis contorta HA4267-MV1]|jgi:hypothetical protein|nr:DUF4351 domain-containing protein [Scytonematopsis contorta HA4267-MV1]
MRLLTLFQQQQERVRQELRQEEGQRIIIRLLNRRIGEIDSSLIERVQGLSIEKLEELGEALLDFSVLSDLETWLAQQ